MKNLLTAAIALGLPACTTLSPTMQLADTLNRQVNREIAYQSDRWVINPSSGAGDCEDYALTKMEKLATANIPSRLEACVLPSGVWHAVAVVDDEGTQWVLDNTRPFAVPKSDFACKIWFAPDLTKRTIYQGK